MTAASSAFMNIGAFPAFGFSGLYNIHAFKYSIKFVAAAFGTFDQFSVRSLIFAITLNSCPHFEHFKS